MQTTSRLLGLGKGTAAGTAGGETSTSPHPSPLPHHFLLQEGRAARGHPPGGDSGRVGGSKWRVSARPGEGPGPQLAWLHCRI